MSEEKIPDSQLTWSKAIDNKGAFVRKESTFRNWIKADGSTQFQPEADRYHLYVSYACPWASRTLMVRSLKGLTKVISVDVVHWLLTEKGWHFDDTAPGATKESVYGMTHLRKIYEKASSTAGAEFDGRVTVPVLFDKKMGLIVNNESSEIIRMLNCEFNQFCETEEQRKLDLYPEPLITEIESVNSWVYPMINNGVYRSGFARSQEAYDEAVVQVFEGLNRCEDILSKQRYIAGNQLTEADIRLFVTLIRFDLVYVLHFKCNRKRIVDYPNIWGYVRDIYQIPGVRDTVSLEHIVKHYHMSHKTINPFGIVPINPVIDLDAKHDRSRFTTDGSTQFLPEANRYHLYVSYACPWASRTLMVRSLKGLTKVMSVDVVHWLLTEKGWHFDDTIAGATKDTVNGMTHMGSVYEKAATAAGQEFDGRVTVPVLFDKKTGQVVNNKSSEIIPMLNDYPNLWGYVRDIYQVPGIRDTVNFEHIVKHYHVSHKFINLFGIVPINPVIDFEAEHDRSRLTS